MAKILVIEDDLPTAELIQMVLAPRGHKVLHTNNGAETLAKAKEFHPDLILLDVMLPGMDGYSVQSQLLGEEETKNIPIIVMTSKSDMEDVFKIASNVAAFIAKPFVVRDFLDKVKNVLDHKPGA